MSLNLLKREVEKDIEVFDAKKLKLEHSKPKKKSKSKGSKFQFNDKDYTKEDDHTDQCLKYLSMLDKTVSMDSEKLIQHNLKSKRQLKVEQETEQKESSIFTDEDFEVISKLHFIHSRKAVIVDDEPTQPKQKKKSKKKSKKESEGINYEEDV